MRNHQPDAALTPGTALATRMRTTFPAEKVVGTRFIGAFPPGKVTGTRAVTALPAAKASGSRMMTRFPAGKAAIGRLGAAFSEISGAVGERFPVFSQAGSLRRSRASMKRASALWSLDILPQAAALWIIISAEGEAVAVGKGMVSSMIWRRRRATRSMQEGCLARLRHLGRGR